VPLAALDRSLHAGDALLEIDWGSLAGGGFDLVIGNPPWVAFAGRAAPMCRSPCADPSGR